MEGEEIGTMRPSYAEKKEEIRREMREERKREGAGEGTRLADRRTLETA